jgi:hypothetical protein
MKICGLDISRNSVTVCVLEKIPSDFRKVKAVKLKLNQKGLESLLELEFDAAILEPTGGHYSRLWAHALAQNGRVIRWVDHDTVESHRRSHRLINKSDTLDAAILAAYGLERWNVKGAFLEEQPSNQLNDLVLQLESLNRIRNPIMNRLKQQLCHEWPEVAERKAMSGKNPPGLWLAIADEKWSPKLKSEYEQSIGLGIGEFSKGLGRLACEAERQKIDLEARIESELERPEYGPYMKVFERFGIGRGSTAASLILAVYPFERFLDGDRKVIKEHVTSCNGKRAARNRSLSAFKMSCGMGMKWFQSGDKQGWRAGGRSVTRRAIWRWVKTQIVMTHDDSNPHIQALRGFYESGTDSWVADKTTNYQAKLKHIDPGIRNQRVQRVSRRFLTALFKELAADLAAK